MTVKSRYLVSAAAVALAVVLMMPSAEANCGTAKAFGQVAGPPTYAYTYTFMPTTSVNTNVSIIGHFWEVGAFSTDNEGSGCIDDAWFPACPGTYPCGGNPTGKTRYIQGVMAGQIPPRPVCSVVGCPAGGDLNTLIQDISTDGQHAFFLLLRVSETPAAGVAYDYTRIGTNSSLVEIPKPFVNSSSRAGTTVNLNLNLNAVNAGFAGLAGQTAQGPGNISGVRIFTFTGNADPGRGRAAGWVADATQRPYTGSTINVPTFGVNCSNTALDVFVAVGLEFDGGTVTTDFVSQPTRVECDPTIADPKYRSIDKPGGKVPR